MLYWSADFLDVFWDDSCQCAKMVWKKFVQGEDFRSGLNKGLNLIMEKKAYRWLADLRNMQVLSIADQAWSNENWFPRAVSGGIRRMAIIYPSSALAKVGVKNIMNKVGEINIETAYFDSVEDAKAWLEEG